MTQTAMDAPRTALPTRREPANAGRVTYVLRQHFRYTYDGPVQDLDHRLVVIPPRRHGDQRLLTHSVTVSADGARTKRHRDRAGNSVIRCRVPLVPDRVEFVVEAAVERVGSGSDPLLPVAALTAPRLLRPTPLTAADPAIRELARTMACQDPLDTAERFCMYVHEAIGYAHGETSIATTAAQALAGGRGVCQDAAHVMIALCRAVGLPTRYVSGHLLGEGGTHAWVEVVVADADVARAVPFDPCNGRRCGMDYLTVATGRDYADVAPTSGTYTGSAQGTLTATKHVGISMRSSGASRTQGV